MPLVLLLLAAIVAQAPANPPQAMTDLDREKSAITQTVLDYAEGYYGGEPARMARAVSPYLSKRGLMAPPGLTPFLLQMNADMLIDASNGAKVAPAERRIRVDVLDVNVEVASARVFTAQFNDYLHLVKRSGHWQILNVLWHAPPTAATPDGVEAAVERAVREYQAACFAGDGQRAQAVVHPVANLRTLAPAPQGRPRVIREQNADSIAAALSSGQMKLAGNPEQARVVVDGVDVDIASARLTLGTVPMYLHLATQAGKWRVVNALGYPPPGGPPGATRQPPAFKDW